MLIPGCTGSPRSAASLSRRVSAGFMMVSAPQVPAPMSTCRRLPTAWMAAEKIQVITPLLQDCAKRLAALSLVSPAFNSR